MSIEKIPPKAPEIIFWLVLVLLMVVSEKFPLDNIWVQSIAKVIFGGAAGFWIYVDSLRYKHISEEFRNGFLVGSILLVEIASPIYVFYSKGFRKGCKSIAIFAVKFVVIGMAAVMVGEVL